MVPMSSEWNIRLCKLKIQRILAQRARPQLRLIRTEGVACFEWTLAISLRSKHCVVISVPRSSKAYVDRLTRAVGIKDDKYIRNEGTVYFVRGTYSPEEHLYLSSRPRDELRAGSIHCWRAVVWLQYGQPSLVSGLNLGAKTLSDIATIMKPAHLDITFISTV